MLNGSFYIYCIIPIIKTITVFISEGIVENIKIYYNLLFFVNLKEK